MADYDPGERRASTWGCAAGIAAVAVVLLAAVAAVLSLVSWIGDRP